MILHISDECSEVCEYLGESLLVAGRHPTNPSNEDEPVPAPYPMILLRSYSQAAPRDFAGGRYDHHTAPPSP